MAAPPEATPSATSTTSDGPVLTVISKRLRTLRKKLNRIHQTELSRSQNKPLNPEQLELLSSKPVVVALIDELDKLRAPVSSALDEELALAPPPPPQLSQPDSSLEDLVKLMYFGSLFDVKQQSEFTSLMLTRTHERQCCLSYDTVTDDDTHADLLGERDLDFISSLQGLMVSRPVHSGLSHQDALDSCFHHAKSWLANANHPIHDQSDVTYAALREKLNKIMSSDYFTATPQMKGPGEVAAAAAVGNFGLFGAPSQESEVNVEVPIQVEERSLEQHQDTEENATSNEAREASEHQPGNADEFQKDELEPENLPEVVSVQTDQEQSQDAEGEHGYRNADFKDQQYVHRRGERGGRGGGGRRGYSNGRGGRGSGRGNGPYQNGRNQYYDNYYPRNNYYPRRGGRGGSAAGGGYYNGSSGAQGNHSQENVGVAS